MSFVSSIDKLLFNENGPNIFDGSLYVLSFMSMKTSLLGFFVKSIV